MRVVAPQGLIAERYRLLRPLGSGASATVWAAQDETLGRQVALKLLSGQAAADGDERNQLRREARALAALAHPHIIVVFDFLETPGLDGEVQPVLVTELLEGRSLSAQLAGGPLPWHEALSVCGQLAAALAAAHRAGIVHRDVTPANVMLTGSGVKLLDFGIAKAAAEDGTVDGLTVGTPVCMAPEQLTGHVALPASDVYALGCVLHWCLTGQPPYRDKDLTWLSHAHLHAAPPPLAVAGLPQGINEFYVACLAKDPAQRPTAEQAAETLAPYAPPPASASGPAAADPDAGRPPQPDDATQMLPILAFTDVAADAAADALPPRGGARRHGGSSHGIDRRRLLPVGLLLAALVIIALLMLGLDHTISGGGTSATNATGTHSAAPTTAASATATVASVTLPSGSAVASPSARASSSPSPSASPSSAPPSAAIPPLPNPAGNPIGYLQALAGQVQALISQGPSTLQPNAGQDLRNSLGDLQNAVASAQQNGGRKQWRTVTGAIAAVQQRIAGDATAGQISAPAANLLTGELQRLAGSLPVNGD